MYFLVSLFLLYSLQLFSRLGAKEKLGDLNLPIFNGINLQPRDVVEFCGAEGTAKSELLLNIVAVCIFPKSWHGIRLPGRSVDAVFISTDFKLDLRRLVTIMEAISQSHGVHQTPQTDCKELISSSLSHLHVVMCDSMDELILSLYSLKTFLKNHPEVCALFIDNIGTFWWTDKVESSAGDVVQQRWSTALAELIREFHLIVFAARPLLTKDVTTHLEKVYNIYTHTLPFRLSG